METSGKKQSTNQWQIQTRRLGGSQIEGAKKVFTFLKYQRLSAKIVGCHTKVITFCRPKSGHFCWSNYAIFQGMTTDWKRFVSLIQKMFETGPKQWASFFPSYKYIVYVQNVFKRYKSMLRARVCLCFGYPERNQWRTVRNAFPTWLELERFFFDLEVTTQVPQAKWRSRFQAKLVHLHQGYL